MCVVLHNVSTVIAFRSKKKKKSLTWTTPTLFIFRYVFTPYNTHNYISGHDVISSVDWCTINFDVKENCIDMRWWGWLTRFKPFVDQMLHQISFFCYWNVCVRVNDSTVEQKSAKLFRSNSFFVTKLHFVLVKSRIHASIPVHDLLN